MTAPSAAGALAATTAPALAGIDVQVVATEPDLLALEPEWNDLLESSSATVFQSFEWVSTWWRYFGGRRALRCVCFRSAGKLVGVAPLYLERVRPFGVFQVARLRFVGRGLADYGDFVIRQGHEPGVINAFAGYLAGPGLHWDVCDLEDLNESSETRRALADVLDPRSITLSTYRSSACPRRPLAASWEEFLQSVGPKLRGNLRRSEKKLDELFETRIEVFASPSDDLAGAVDSFSAIHGARWRSVGFPSAFDDAHHRRFHLDIAQRFASRGWLRLTFVNVDGERVAVSFDFRYRRRIYVYQCNAAGPAEVMKWSPGGLVKAAAIRAGIEDGMEVYDLLRGDEAYKVDQWKCTPSENHLFRLSSVRSRRARLKAFFLWELAQKGVARAKREYHGLRQFTATKRPSLRQKATYVLARLAVLWALAKGYLARNLGRGPTTERRTGAHRAGAEPER